MSRPGPGQLPAHGQGQQAADEEPEQRGEQELDADDLVVVEKTYLLQEARRVRRARARARACSRGVRTDGDACSFRFFLRRRRRRLHRWLARA